jgi:hypothetical protein
MLQNNKNVGYCWKRETNPEIGVCIAIVESGVEEVEHKRRKVQAEAEQEIQ